MARLIVPMPDVQVNAADLQPFGTTWLLNRALSRTPPYSSGSLTRIFDSAVATALAQLLGGIAVVQQSSNSLIPPQADCVEVGSPRVVGGVRPQNFDVCYRPDGVRFAFDSKTLNSLDSIRKNWQNMINDLATEATTVHSRFPHALVAFLVAFPVGALQPAQQASVIETLERLARRVEVNDPLYMAEAIAFVLWDPSDGSIHPEIPSSGAAGGDTSPIRLENFSRRVESIYLTRYKGLPPHAD
jgi:hypothetical protein